MSSLSLLNCQEKNSWAKQLFLPHLPTFFLRRNLSMFVNLRDQSNLFKARLKKKNILAA